MGTPRNMRDVWRLGRLRAGSGVQNSTCAIGSLWRAEAGGQRRSSQREMTQIEPHRRTPHTEGSGRWTGADQSRDGRLWPHRCKPVGLRLRQKCGAGDALRDTLQKVVDEDAGCGGKQRKPGPARPAWRGITEWGGGDGPWKRGPTLLGDAAKFRIPLT